MAATMIYRFVRYGSDYSDQEFFSAVDFSIYMAYSQHENWVMTAIDHTNGVILLCQDREGLADGPLPSAWAQKAGQENRFLYYARRAPGR